MEEGSQKAVGGPVQLSLEEFCPLKSSRRWGPSRAGVNFGKLQISCISGSDEEMIGGPELVPRHVAFTIPGIAPCG